MDFKLTFGLSSMLDQNMIRRLRERAPGEIHVLLDFLRARAALNVSER